MKTSFQPDDLMAILDGIADAVVKLDGQANFVAMNQSAANIYQRLGLNFQDMKGKSVWELFPELKGTPVNGICVQFSKTMSKSDLSFTTLQISIGTKQRGIRLPLELFWSFGTLRTRRPPLLHLVQGRNTNHFGVLDLS